MIAMLLGWMTGLNTVDHGFLTYITPELSNAISFSKVNYHERLAVKHNPSATNVTHHIETSKLVCIANQLAAFYMTENIAD